MSLLFRIHLSEGPGYPLAQTDLVVPASDTARVSVTWLNTNQTGRLVCHKAEVGAAVVIVNVPDSFVPAHQKFCYLVFLAWGQRSCPVVSLHVEIYLLCSDQRHLLTTVSRS